MDGAAPPRECRRAEGIARRGSVQGPYRRVNRLKVSLPRPERFTSRHIGPRPQDIEDMVETLGYESLDAFIDAVVPEDIRLRRPLALPKGRSEREVLRTLRSLGGQNQIFRSYLGM